MIALKRLRNSLTITPESIPAGGRMAVTDEPGELENNWSPKAAAAVRVGLANICAFSIKLGIPSCLMYRSASDNASNSEVFGVQADSPVTAFFFSFFRSK